MVTVLVNKWRILCDDFRSLDISALIGSVVGALLTIALVYYGLRTLKLLKTNVAARAWTFISLGALFFGIGLVMFIVDAVDPMGLPPAGGDNVDYRRSVFGVGIEEELLVVG